MSFVVRVPASSANLGPGFDTLGMALSMHAEVGLVDDGVADGARTIDEHHPASIAYRRCGGQNPLWLRCSIPNGRGLGFSGAVRVAGAIAASAERGESIDTDRVLQVASELEGHADNVAASLHGGVVATAAGRAVRVPLPFDPAVVVWIPSSTTSTDESRSRLGGSIAFDDAVFNVGRTALLVAALAAGDIAVLRDATADRLHQDVRFAAADASRAALDAALGAGAWCAWLSGSGPTVAAMCSADRAEVLAEVLPSNGSTKVLRIDHAGAVIEAP